MLERKILDRIKKYKISRDEAKNTRGIVEYLIFACSSTNSPKTSLKPAKDSSGKTMNEETINRKSRSKKLGFLPAKSRSSRETRSSVESHMAVKRGDVSIAHITIGPP